MMSKADLIEELHKKRNVEEELNAHEKKYNHLLDSMAEMVEVIELIYDEDGHPIDWYIRQINISFTKFLGKPREELINKKVTTIITTIEQHWFNACASVDKTGKPINFEEYGVEFNKHYSVNVWKVSENRLGISFIDITDRKLAEIELIKHKDHLEEMVKVRTTELREQITQRRLVEEEVRRMAMTDHLTSLANRRHFKQRIEQCIKLAKRENKFLAMMMIDLDKFKPINDTFGHLVGDELLQSVALILIKHSRDSDLVVRLGGDEFVILVIHPESEDGVKTSAKRITDEIKKPIHIKGHKIEISLSIGIALYPENAKNEEELMKNSDLALYEIKKQGGGGFLFYHQNMSAE